MGFRFLLLKILNALYCKYSSLHEWISNDDNAYLIGVSNAVDQYTTDSLVFMCIYLAYFASFMWLNIKIRLLAVTITNKKCTEV